MRALLFSTKGLSVIIYASFAYEGLFARFCNILAIWGNCGETLCPSRWRFVLYQCKCPAGMFCRDTVNEHISLGCNNCWIDETKEEKSTNERANGIVRSFRILALSRYYELYNKDSRRIIYPRQTTNLFANPPNPIRNALHTFNNR